MSRQPAASDAASTIPSTHPQRDVHARPYAYRQRAGRAGRAPFVAPQTPFVDPADP